MKVVFKIKGLRILFPQSQWGAGVFGLVVSALVSPTFSGTTMDALVNAAARFSAAIEEQLKAVQGDPEPAEFA